MYVYGKFAPHYIEYRRSLYSEDAEVVPMSGVQSERDT